MTDLAESLQLTARIPRLRGRVIPTLAAGLFGGFALGVIARAWMRLISDEPEFSWNGTIFIVAAFTICGLTQAIAAVARRRAKRRWPLTIARVVGTIGLMPLFVAAGSIMMPTVVAGGLALNRTDWHKGVRWLCSALAMAPVLFVCKGIVDSFGFSLHSLAGIALFGAVYGTVIAATRFTMAPQRDGWRLPRAVKVVLFALLGLAVLWMMAGVIFH